MVQVFTEQCFRTEFRANHSVNSKLLPPSNFANNTKNIDMKNVIQVRVITSK